MRARKKDKQNLIKVGYFISGLAVVLIIMIASIGKENSVFDSKVELKARVENVSNLKPGSYVELKGIRIGTVSSIDIISEDEVEITLRILEKQLKWIKQDSKVSVSTAGLVGDKFLEIYGGTKSSPAVRPETDVLLSGELTDMKQILSKGESIATVTDRILNKLDQILFNLDDGKKIVETFDSMKRTSSNLERITSELKDAKMGEMVKNVNSAMGKLSRASGSMEKIMSRIEHGPGTMNSLIYDDSVHEDLRALLGGAQRNKVIKYFIRQSIEKAQKKKD